MRAPRMLGRACRIGLLLLPLLLACGTSADFAAEADAAASEASDDASGAGVTVSRAVPPNIESPCFRRSGAEAWTCSSDGVTLARTRAGSIEKLQCPHGCVSLPDGFDSQCRPRDGWLGSTVNGHAMTGQQASWVSYFAWCAVPLLLGTRDARITAASTVAWWALKEGVLDEGHPGPIGFSRAFGSAWQVGASGIQPSCCKLGNVESTAAVLFPGMTEAQLLSGVAVEAGYPIGSAEHARIVRSGGAMRASWLLRVTAIGFFRQAPIVTDECIAASKSWCYGTGWITSAAYAPDKSSAMRAMSDVRAILDFLSP